VHQSIVTFSYWAIEDDYFNYLGSEQPSQLLPFLKLRSSSAFDLEKVDGRLEAVYEIMSLTYFWDEEIMA
jgi:hypothetical protein